MTSPTLFNSLSHHKSNIPFSHLKSPLAPLVLGLAILLAGIAEPEKTLRFMGLANPDLTTVFH